MKIPNPLQHYCEEMRGLLNGAKKEKESALWLYENDMRTTLFMMEALLRLFNYDTKYKDFNAKHKLVKKLEDALGQIDYYDAILKEFSNSKRISGAVRSYLELKKIKSLKKFQKRLIKTKWLNKGFNDFETELHGSGPIFNKENIMRIEKIIRAELYAVEKFAVSRNFHFKEVETEMHELRRKLRWISIYAASLQGIVTLADDKRDYPWKKKYLSESVINSPYNKLPVSKAFPRYIYFEKNHFLALSWMIQELGVLKDKAMTVEIIAKAIRKTQNASRPESVMEAHILLKIKPTNDALLKQASEIAKEFFVKNKITQNLIRKSGS